jgi:RNA polymerase sigma-70 factor (ECF subfamily)
VDPDSRFRFVPGSGDRVQRRAPPRQEEDVDPETRFRALFDLAYAPLGRYARHRGLTGQDAEDLVAQTLEVAWRRIEDVPAEPLPWLYAVAQNLWRNQARKDRRRRDLLARFRPPPAAGCEDPGSLEPGVLRAALASLSDGDQEVLRLVAWDGLTPAEVAVVLGCTPVAARSRLHRARSRLAAQLGISPGLQRGAPAGQKQGDSPDFTEVPR